LRAAHPTQLLGGGEVRLFNDEAHDSCWSMAMDGADASLGLAKRYYQAEWKEVVLAQGCRSRDDYLVARRVGRGTRISREQRSIIWPVFDAVRAEFRQRGLWEPEEAKQIATDQLNQPVRVPLYAAVVVDEAQDLELDASQMPLQVEWNKRPDQLSKDLFEQQERSLLHGAATRALQLLQERGRGAVLVGADLLAGGRSAQLKRVRAEAIAEELITAVRDWPRFGSGADLPEDNSSQIQASHRLNL
jgi:hypothetical protein